jgi:hypothetical protein
MLLVEEEKNFEISMLLPLAIVVFSALSFVFHLKTLSFYRENVITKAHYRKDKPFWIANLVFAFSLFLLALFFCYQFYQILESSIGIDDAWPFIIIIAVPLGLTLWVLLDAHFLYKSLKTSEAKAAFNNIDNISGIEEN